MSIINLLHEEKVIDVALSENKDSVKLLERCDEFYCVNLNKDEFGMFIEELKSIHGQMVEPKK